MKKIFLTFFHFLNKLFSTKSYNLIRLGSDYGGWNLINNSERINNSTVISAGVGEDLSFDFELINEFSIKNIALIDPTPRAYKYYRESTSKPREKSTDYVEGGYQPFETYNINNNDISKIIYFQSALWSESNKKLKFYSPQNKKNVSSSLSKNINFVDINKYEEVTTITVSDIIAELEIKKLSILKLDIESSEVEVINHVLKNKIYPDQILVEFDIFKEELLKSYMKVIFCIIKLFFSGYKSVEINDFPNFLYVRNKAFENDSF